MKVCLTHGYFLHEDPAEQKIMKPYPPAGLLYLAAWLRKEGISNEVVDATFINPEELKKQIENCKPGIIGIYSTLMTKKNVLKIISFIRGNRSLLHSRIIIGGPDARYNATGYLLNGADVVIPGEGEGTLTETIRVFSNGNIDGLSGINGLIYMGADGSVVNTGEAKLLEMDEIAIPSRDSVDMPAYLNTWKLYHGYSSLTMNTMRGCPYSCNWCSKSIFGNAYRRRNAVAVVEEMMLLADQYHPDQVWFTDDVFTISREWIRQFAREVSQRNIFMPYECISRADCLDGEILDLLRSSGCRKLWIGAESGSQKVIDLMDRRINIDQTIRVINQAKEKGISTGNFIMLGYPGEKKKDILLTAEFLKKAHPQEITTGLAYPIIGTRFYEQVEPGFTQPFHWESTSEKEIVWRRPYSERFYRYAVRLLHNISKSANTVYWKKRAVYKFKALLARGFILLFN